MPTWNHAVVHAHGTPVRLGDDALLTLRDDERKFKLSQNRDPSDQARVVEAFRERGETELVFS